MIDIITEVYEEIHLSEMLPKKSYFDRLGYISLLFFGLSLIPVGYTAEFLYSSKIILFDRRLFYVEAAFSCTYLIVMAVVNVISNKFIGLKCILCLLITILSAIVEIFFGSLITNDQLYYFTTLEESWHAADLEIIKKIQTIYFCCDFQPTIIDAKNDCHHGFLKSFIEVIPTHHGSQAKKIGLLFIIQGFAHLSLFFIAMAFYMKDKKYTKSLKNSEKNDCIPLNQPNIIINT